VSCDAFVLLHRSGWYEQSQIETELLWKHSANVEMELPNKKGIANGFNVIGYASGNLGLGVSVRNIAKLLVDNRHSIAVLDLEPGLGRGRQDASFDACMVKSPADLPYSINLAVLAVAALPSFLLDPPTVLLGESEELQPGFDYWFANDRLNVAVVWWELNVLPPLWIRALEAFDIVVAPSPFIRSTLETHLSNVLTIPAVHPFSIPAGITPSRARFGLPEDAVLFATSFAPQADPERKNAFGVLDAFQRAFPDDPRTLLVVKLNNADVSGPTIMPIMVELRNRCLANPRIRIIDAQLCYTEVLSLYASCDAFVSLHRSEGLGFGLMEAMALGKPVIATAWSGNMAFMDHTNSCLVRYKLIPVQATLPDYSARMIGETARWADPDVDEAAAWMKRLVDHPEIRVSIGHRAAAAMIEYQELARKAKFVEEVQVVWRNAGFLPRRSIEEKVEKVQAVRQALYRHRESLLPFRQRLRHEFRRAADRHVLWRFR
jgi:glycosyltransferase involved in cell wall biosynthesis